MWESREDDFGNSEKMFSGPDISSTPGWIHGLWISVMVVGVERGRTIHNSTEEFIHSLCMNHGFSQHMSVLQAM